MLKVMLIEDNQTMVSLLTTLLKMEGYTVEAPHNHHLDGFIQAILTEQPHLAFVDVNLRHGSGLELVRRIRQDPDASDTRIIMSSGLNLKYECIQAGADGFIQKPFMPEDLIKLIHTTINKKKTKK
ncbi:MAG: response regulator [Acidobacteriaceae bacterium]